MTIMRNKLSRRQLFAGLGGAGAMSLLPLLRGSQAVAQAGEIPKRVVFVHFADGMVFEDWEPRPKAGASSYTRTDFAMGPNFDPLVPYFGDMILFENMDMRSVDVDPTDPANAHHAGGTHYLTADNRLGGDQPGAKSIDQFIADELLAAGGVTALKSMEIAMTANGPYNDGWTGPNTIDASTGPGERMGGLVIPHEIYERLFPGSAEAPEADNSAARARAERLFSFLKGEHGQMAQRLSGDDRLKLEQHAQLMTELEQRRLALLSENRRDLWPDPSIVDPAADLNWTYNADRDTIWRERWEIATDINMRLAAAALHADVTRVMTLSMDQPPGAVYGYSDGMFDSTDYHDLVHKVNDLNQETPQYSNVDARQILLAEKHALLNKLLILVNQLDTLQEVDGSRMLDHTIIVLTSHIANGSHSVQNLPWFTLGNLDGVLNTGQLISFERQQDPERSWVTHGRAHNDFFVSVAQALGLDVSSFGNPDVNGGPITEMFA